MRFFTFKKRFLPSALGLGFIISIMPGLALASSPLSVPATPLSIPPAPLSVPVASLVVPPAMASFSHSLEDSARLLLLKAFENQYRGPYQASLELVNQIFPNDRDSLLGLAEFSDAIGERRISLAGPKQAFEYRSRFFGKEQWIVDDHSHRIRRIANRQWKKGVFGNLLSYEDILKFPNDFFLEYASCGAVKATDSAYQIEMKVRPLFQSFYSKLDITLGRAPVLVKSITFYGLQGQILKTMDVNSYQSVAGKWLVSDLSISASDSLSQLTMRFSNFAFTANPLAQNGGRAAGNPIFFSKLVPKGMGINSELGIEKTDPEAEGLEEISN